MIERKRRKIKPKQEGTKLEVCTTSGTPSPGSTGCGKTTETDITLFPEKVSVGELVFFCLFIMFWKRSN